MVNLWPTLRALCFNKGFVVGALHLSRMDGDSPNELVNSDSVKICFVLLPHFTHYLK